MHVLCTPEDDGSLRVTAACGDDDHRFEVTKDGNDALIEYEETQCYNGEIRVAEPDENTYKEVMLSDEVTEYLNKHNLNGIKRKHHK